MILGQYFNAFRLQIKGPICEHMAVQYFGQSIAERIHSHQCLPHDTNLISSQLIIQNEIEAKKTETGLQKPQPLLK